MCDYKEMAPEIILSKITLQTSPNQTQNPMSAALWSGHANCGRANMGSERGPCTLFWLTLQHMDCAANRSASPWPRIVGATCTVTALYVTQCREVEALHEAPTLAHPCAYVSIQSFFFWLPNTHTQSLPANVHPRRCARLLARTRFQPSHVDV